YPSPSLGVFYPKVGNFIGFVSNVRSRALLRHVIGLFRKHAKIPSEAASLPAFIPGVSWSDQWSFWQHGYPAIMVTDTAPFRYPYYHSSNDMPDKLDYDRFTLVVSALEKVSQWLANLELGALTSAGESRRACCRGQRPRLQHHAAHDDQRDAEVNNQSGHVH